MILENGKNKRIAIYFFYDKYGIVDRFVEYFLTDLKRNVDTILIVCNGKLNEEGNRKLKKYGELLIRENKGFDVWAYKKGIEHIGWDELYQYDELIMLNSTILGPIYPLKETFDKMDSLDLDFWGLTKYFKYDDDPFNCISYGYIPNHIQSHFIAVRNKMLRGLDFKKYWEEMPMIHDYREAIGLHEAIFTKHFADLGYKWDVSVNVDDLRDYSGYPLMMCPKKLIEEYRCPIFKRRSFFHDIDDYLNNTTGEQTSELFEYLDKETDYDVDMIWETILRNYPQSDIVKNLNLTYVLPTEFKKETLNNKKIALVIHVYFDDILDQTRHYISSMPNYADIYITTDTTEKKEKIENAYADLKFNKLEVRLIQNRGRDVSSLLVGVKDVIMDYDIVCFAHDKKTAQVSPGTLGNSFAYKCFENTLSNKVYVENIIATFNENPRLGMLTPPEPNHGPFFPTIGFEWGPNYDITKKLAKKLNLTVPISVDKQPVAPFGTMFWFRPKAMKPLYDYDWEYKDFPPEPNGIDGTLLHAIERIYPFIIQQSGYYPAIVMTDKFAAIEYNNLRHYVRGYNRVIIGHGIGPEYVTMLQTMNYQLTYFHRFRRKIKYRVKRLLPKSILKKIKKLKNKEKDRK